MENATSRSSARAGLARVDRARRDGDPVRQIRDDARGHERACGVQHYGVPFRAAFAPEDPADRRSVLGRDAAAQLGRVGTLDAEVARIERHLRDLAVCDLDDEIRAGGRQLVDPAGAVDDERAARAEPRERFCVRAREVGRVHAEHAVARSGRVRERPEDVEYRAGSQLLSHRRGVPHRGVVGTREHEAEAVLVDRGGDPLGRQLEREPELLEHVRRTAGRARGAIAVLRHCRARRRRDDRRRGRDVERVCAVAARPDDVHDGRASGRDGEDVLAHRLGEARDLLDRLALRAQPDEQPADLGGVASPRMTAPITSRASSRERSRPSAIAEIAATITRESSPPSRAPSGVSTLSGWNWTPSTG